MPKYVVCMWESYNNLKIQNGFETLRDKSNLENLISQLKWVSYKYKLIKINFYNSEKEKKEKREIFKLLKHLSSS